MRAFGRERPAASDRGQPIVAGVSRLPVDTAQVHRLIAAQFPQWKDLPIRPVDHGGWDNRTFHLGPAMAVRLPSAQGYAAQVEKEHRWLPVLAPQLPLPIPVPLAMGVPGEGYPFPWSIYGWIDGVPATVDRLASLTGFATHGRTSREVADEIFAEFS